MEIFGEEPFAPVQKPESVVLTEKQEKLSVLFDSKSGQLTNQYIKGDERSFTIVAYPVPEIGAQYKEIFDEVIRINTLDANVYKNVQQDLIDALDKGGSTIEPIPIAISGHSFAANLTISVNTSCAKSPRFVNSKARTPPSYV